MQSCFSASSSLYPRARDVYAGSAPGRSGAAGVVRGWSRKDHAPVSSVTVSHDQAKMDAICHEMEQRPGIFAIVAQANEGELQPGDDLLLLVVAGDIRENVKATFAELLDRIKSEAVIKQEHGPEA